VRLQASHDPVQGLSQQIPSAQELTSAQSVAAWQVCPLFFLHAPVASQVPAQTPGSSWLLTAVHTPMVHVWHAPAQSLLVTHPTHWLLAVSHLAATPVQCLSAVHATQRPLLAQAGPFRPVQSVSAAHFAHRLPRQSGLCAGQSLSILQVPGASRTGVSNSGMSSAASSPTSRFPAPLSTPLLPIAPPGPIVPPPAPAPPASLPPLAWMLPLLPPSLVMLLPPPPLRNEAPSPTVRLTPLPKHPAKPTMDRQKEMCEIIPRKLDTRSSLSGSR